MRTFTDNAGRTWTVAIHVAAVKRVRAILEIDLYGLVNEGFERLAELCHDPVTLVDLLYVLCQDEAEKRGVSDEDFGRAMAGDSIERATMAFIEALTDFFPNPRVRAGLKRVMATAGQTRDHLIENWSQQIDQFDPKAEAAKIIAKAEAEAKAKVEATNLSGSSGGSPASSGSTPDPSPFASST